MPRPIRPICAARLPWVGALATLLNGSSAESPPVATGGRVRAKRVIYLFQSGAPSQLDLFDYKPKLNQYDGQPCPEELIRGERFAFIKGVPELLGSPHTFGKHGQSGAELSNLLGSSADRDAGLAEQGRRLDVIAAVIAEALR